MLRITFNYSNLKDVAEKIGLNFMTMYQLYPEPSKEQTRTQPIHFPYVFQN